MANIIHTNTSFRLINANSDLDEASPGRTSGAQR